VDVSGYDKPVTRFVTKLILLVAVLLMPVGMTAEPAAAHAMPSATMPMQHCPDQTPSNAGKAGIPQCMMVCSAALPAADAPTTEPHIIVCLPEQPARADALRGLHPETATPPPKHS
jgi:hypothetical protein